MANLNTSKLKDDEIDLIELLEKLWDAKVFVAAITVISTVFGLVYALVAAPSYEITSRVFVHVYPAVTQQICNSSIDCLEKETADAAITVLGGDWELSRDGSSVSISAASPLPLTDYDAALNIAARTLTDRIYTEAETEIALIENVGTGPILSTERVATNILNAKRVIHLIDSGQPAVSFEPVQVQQTAPRTSLILLLSCVLGLFLGSATALIRDAILARSLRK